MSRKPRIPVDEELKEILEEVVEEKGFRSQRAALNQELLDEKFRKILQARKNQTL